MTSIAVDLAIDWADEQEARAILGDRGSGCLKVMESTEMDDVDADSSVGKWFVYIVRCADNSLYTGITKDVDRRLKQHNADAASRYTRGRLPVSLEYQEEQPSQGMALKRELAIKTLSRQERESLI